MKKAAMPRSQLNDNCDGQIDNLLFQGLLLTKQ